MKKVLLSALAVSASLFATAQTAVTETQTDAESGYAYVGKDFAQDDFATATEYGAEDLAGLYWWDQVEAKPNGFKATKTRNEGGMEVVVTQPTKVYEPFGLSLGDAAENNPFIIDLTDSATIFMTVTNHSDEAIKVRAAVQDADGDILDLDADKTQIVVDIAAGATETLEADYTGGYNAKWEGECKPCYVQEVDLAKVKGINVTVLSSDQESAGIEDVKVEITSIKLGNTPFEEETGLFDFATGNDFEVYPNPASTTVNFATDLTNGAVYNAQGVVVAEFARASELNISDLQEGVYVVKAAEGSSRFVVK